MWEQGVTWGSPGYSLVSVHAEPKDGKEGLTQIFGQLGWISWAAGTNLCLSLPPPSTEQSCRYREHFAQSWGWLVKQYI